MSELPPGPLIIAHRGFSAEYPENTLASFRGALEVGVDGCECDTHLSSDGAIILLHDDTLKRTCGVDRPASDLTFDELRQLDAGSWKGPQFAGEQLPTLVEALELHRGRSQLVIEVKARGDIATVVYGVLQAIEQTDAYGWCSIISFGWDYLAELARHEPRLPCLWLASKLPTEEADRRDLLERALEAGFRGFDIHHAGLDAAFIRACHRQAMSVWAWTVNQPEQAAPLVAWGIDGLTTDRPDWLRSWLAARA